MSVKTTPEQIFYSSFNANVKALNTGRRLIGIQINDALKRNDNVSLHALTKIYCLLYFSWTEALLVKLVHTPYGFTLDEKNAIFNNQDVLQKWRDVITISFDRFTIRKYDIPKKLNNLNSCIKKYLQDQARVRNKIAHGQWEYPLQKNNIVPDEEAKIFVDCLNVLEIDMWFDVFTKFSEIVEGLIDSREKNGFWAHFGYYNQKMQSIENLIKDRSVYSLEKKKELLLAKSSRKPKTCPTCPYS